MGRRGRSGFPRAQRDRLGSIISGTIPMIYNQRASEFVAGETGRTMAGLRDRNNLSGADRSIGDTAVSSV